MYTLLQLGIKEYINQEYNSLNTDLNLGRISKQNRTNYEIFSEKGEYSAQLTGKFIFDSDGLDLPAVGDWVIFQEYDDNAALIVNVIEPINKLTRKASGSSSRRQNIVTNIDYVFIMQSANENFNLNRYERQITAALACNAQPVIVLSKIDLINNTAEYLYKMQERISHPIFAISTLTGQGVTELTSFLKEGTTSVILGSSGVGKSTLINRLIGTEKLSTQSIREGDSKGKHTTTSREMIVLPTGGIIIDTPGTREFGLTADENNLNDAFDEILIHAEFCKYADCTHVHESGCGVKQAVEDGVISEARYENYIKLRKEAEYFHKKESQLSSQIEKRKWKNIHKEIKRMKKRGGKY